MQRSNEYDHLAVEARARALWEERGIYRFDRAGHGAVFSIDTPPPYVSASHLHVGHAMSYSQPDFIARYRRMRGERVFYPMGFDDNGLPTERYVEQQYGVRAADMPRAEFVRLCLAETGRTAARYAELWRRMGLSVDWDLRYSTIDSRCQKTAQTSFIKLCEAGHIRRAEDPIIWCPECRTALAQADVEDLERKSRLHRIAFHETRTGRRLVIATSRPELISACVALYCHPADERYRDLAGRTAQVPLTGHQVPIRTDESVDPEFGTGLLMVCTFGDGDDVVKWRRDALDLRLVVEADGRLGALAGPLAGMRVDAARRGVVDLLAESGALVDSAPIRQVVGVHERCTTPIEFQIRPQWFVTVQRHRDRFRDRAAELTWLPPYMRRRLEDWIDGLKWDWNISRQRHYGVPFPVWYCQDCEKALFPELDTLPVDPVRTAPPVAQCPECGGIRIEPDRDVMDTWMTSSLTPQINDGWAAGAAPGTGQDPALVPMSLRVQSFEIIRTWLFYTVVQSELLFGRLPWRAVMISGHGLNEQGKKIAKRDLQKSTTADGFNRYVPDQVIEKYGADALRLWATSARIGNDLRYHEKDVRTGRKFTVKLWNVGRFIELHQGDVDPGGWAPLAVADRTLVDRWLLSHLAETVDQVTAALDESDYMQAHRAAARFFWSIFCDRYIEMVKDRFLDQDRHSDADRHSARWTLREAFRTLLGLFAPFAPFVTEDLYQRFYQPAEGTDSLHVTRWPAADPEWRTERSDIDDMATMLDTVRALRSQQRLAAGTRVATLVLHPPDERASALARRVAEPLRAAARADQVVLAGTAGGDGTAVRHSAAAGIGIALIARTAAS